MAPTFARYCPHCGTPVQADIHQCSICCLPVGAIHEYSSNDQDQQSAKGKALQTIVATQMVRVASFVHLASQSGKCYRRVNTVFVVPIFLLILGIGGYLAFTGLHWHQAPIKTVSVHIPLTYVGLSVTVSKVQQAQNFVNDPQTVDDGMVRLYLQEQNTTTIPITWNYAQCAHLVILSQPLLAPIYVQSKGRIAPGATQSSVLDFAVPDGGDLSTMSFQLGTANEADVRAPLLGQIDSHQYQPQTHAQHGNMTYLGLDWSLMHSTTSLSIPGQQAAQGMEYLTLVLAVNNTLSQEVITGSPFDYVRAKINGQTFRPVSTTLPVSFTPDHWENVATTFLIPQKSSAGTFLLISQNSDGSGQASANFSLAHGKPAG